ncbi:MAG: endonuclease III domain-containing protein [Myxococcota bacterium]
MRRAEKAERIGKILDRIYPRPTIPLRHQSPFELLVAVVLSAQCTDLRVNQVTPALFALAGTPEEMARTPVPEILRRIRSCGLAPTKARNLSALSRAIVREHGGQVPRDREALEALPGVGRKTASVVRLQAFGYPELPVDTHIHRLARRWGLSRGQSVAQTEGDLKRLFPEARWGSLHLQLIWFGREYCPALGHDPARCLICSWAASRAQIDRERRARASRSSRGLSKPGGGSSAPRA